MREKIILIDGHSIINRAFYGIPELTNAQGLHTNAIYGFLNILFKILGEEKGEYLMVAFDVKAPTFRHEIFKEYKGTRKPMPEELREQVPVLKEVLKAMGIATIEKAGLEADDILGTIAKQAEALGKDVSLISGDRDLLQIATEHIKIRIPKTRGGKTEVEDYYAEDVLAKYQVTPLQFIELKALMGDPADNIPGVPRVGEKTATELLKKYATIDEIYAHIEEITKKSIKASLIENRNLADLSKVLATIKIDADISYELEDARIGDIFTKEAYDIFKILEFKNFLLKFKNIAIPKKNLEFKEVEEISEIEKIFQQAAVKDLVALHMIEDGKKQEDVLGVAIAYSEKDIYYIKVQGFVTRAYLFDKVVTLVNIIQNSPKEQTIAGFYLKQIYASLQANSSKRFFDVELAAYLLNPLKNDYDIDDIANEYLGLQIASKKELFLKSSLRDSQEEHQNKVLEYAGNFVYVIYQAAKILEDKLEKAEMKVLFYEMEMPLTFVLYEMEEEGIKVQPEELKAYGLALINRINELETLIYQGAGTTFNINSPKQVGEILFETMELPGAKKTKTGYSTAVDVLEKLSLDYPIVADILEYRGLAKLKSTYADGLANYIQEDSRIHTTFNQTITATGRISSTEPNLQNIPMRMELGRLIRKVFIPKEGYVFIDADYSQIELRILAHMSEDEQLIEAYRKNEDIHKITASQVFNIPFDQVTDLQRRNAKAVNFGIVYGISAFGLSEDLGISKKEAALYIENYFATYPKVKIFLEKLVADAKEKGYVTTIFGRRRPVPELSSSNFMQRSFGSRIAMNSPIQGTAADIMKIAMLGVQDELKKQKLKSKLVLQIHDELLIEAAEDEIEIVEQILENEMKNAADLAVTLEIDSHTGYNWYEVK